MPPIVETTKAPPTIAQICLRALVEIAIGRDKVALYHDIDWQQEIAKFQRSDVIYPDYYTSQNFHGIEGGYLNPIAPITYDIVSAWASPPNEMWIRQQVMEEIDRACADTTPQQILDFGCGTGSQTILLKQAIPTAAVTGIDLSPHMLWIADYKARQAGVEIAWANGLAEATTLPAGSVDLITICFLFHETPPAIARSILTECYRLLRAGGRVFILDGDQRVLRRATWLIKLFREPYSQAYAAGDVTEWLQAAGFTTIQSRYLGWIDRLTSATK
jgi:ubiquinone/menaquinone biosynthesis C-methylase UbiE